MCRYAACFRRSIPDCDCNCDNATDKAAIANRAAKPNAYSYPFNNEDYRTHNTHSHPHSLANACTNAYRHTCADGNFTTDTAG